MEEETVDGCRTAGRAARRHHRLGQDRPGQGPEHARDGPPFGGRGVHRLQGVDYPEHTSLEWERPVVDAVRARLVKELAAGHEIVLDHGLWLREDREAWKKTVEAAGGRPLLVFLPVEKGELLRRLEERNRRAGDANPLKVSPEALDAFLSRFEPPADDENAIIYTGDVEAVYRGPY